MHISLGVRLQIWGADEHDLAVYCNGLVLQVYISILSFKIDSLLSLRTYLEATRQCICSPIGECPLDYVDPHVGGGAQLAFPCRMVEAAAMVNFLMGTSQHYRRC